MFTFILKQGTEGNLCKFDTSLTAVEFTWKTQPNAIQNYGGGSAVVGYGLFYSKKFLFLTNKWKLWSNFALYGRGLSFA